MKIAIHPFKNSFSDRWVKYCETNNIKYKIVNCFDSDINEQLRDCEGLMWHWSQEDPRTVLFAKQLTKALELGGKKVFPDSRTCWHFDDKIAQKYLLESLKAPMVATEVYYDLNSALSWTKESSFPKVFKLRAGAGAINVRLVKNERQGKRLAKKAFGRGFGVSGRTALFKNRLWRFRRDLDLDSFVGIFKGLVRLFLPSKLERVVGRERGYYYVQDFIPNNKSDIRVITIKDKAFAIERMVRKGDFRASGSGLIRYLDNNNIDKRCVKTAFEVSEKIGAQCLAYDFIYDVNNEPLIVEISYGFSMKAYDKCLGYWDSNLNWTEKEFVPQFFMIEDFLKEIEGIRVP